MYCIVLYCIALHCIALYCIVCYGMVWYVCMYVMLCYVMLCLCYVMYVCMYVCMYVGFEDILHTARSLQKVNWARATTSTLVPHISKFETGHHGKICSHGVVFIPEEKGDGERLSTFRLRRWLETYDLQRQRTKEWHVRETKQHHVQF